jgi:plastocyanin
LTVSAAAALIVAGTAIAWADQVVGTVGARTRPGATRGTVVVFAEPMEGAVPVRPSTVRLEQKEKTFRPMVLGIPVGSTVEFPNLDPIFHNVFSLSTPQPFDLGLYRAGSSKARTFTQSGTYWIFCNIHPQMAAFVVVVPTTWVTVGDAQGAYRLDLPRGRFRLTALSERAAPVSAELVVSGGSVAPPLLQLDETPWVGAAHKNKFGQDYPASAYDPGRKP